MPDLADDAPQVPLRSGRVRFARLRSRWPVALVLVWASLAVVDIVVFHVGAGSTQSAAAQAGSRPTSGAHSHTAQPSAATPPLTPGLLPVELTPSSAAAFGPGGYGSGDNPQLAALAIDASPATAWETSWYLSARFGNLQDGTGLMIDMGRSVTINTVWVRLGATRGADLELLTGEVPELADLSVAASANDVGGEFSLSPSAPVRARYLLIWFTLLPPDSSGTYQASVYNVTIEGTP